MAARKEVRSDNTYIISTDDTDNPKLGAKILSDGRESLFLDYYLGYKMIYDEAKDKEVPRKERKREALKLVHPTFRVMRQSWSAYNLSSKYRSSLNPYAALFKTFILLLIPSTFLDSAKETYDSYIITRVAEDIAVANGNRPQRKNRAQMVL